MSHAYCSSYVCKHSLISEFLLTCRLVYPNKLSELLNVDSHQRLVIRFSLKDADFNKLNKIQQSFVKLINKKTGVDATFVCQFDSSRTFKLNLVSNEDESRGQNRM